MTDGRYPRAHLLAAVAAAAAHGVDWVQVRDPTAGAGDLARLAADIVAICRPLGVRVAVNDRVDVALAVAADGVQLGERSLPPSLVRPLVGRRAIGVSVHGIAAARAATAAADWLTFGHVFPTTSHPGEAARGLAGLAAIVRQASLSTIAIGGIDVARTPMVLAAGAAGVAVISAILEAADPARATAALRQALDA